MDFGFQNNSEPALPGVHPVLKTSLTGPWPLPHEILYVAMGCFWGVERIYWSQPGVINTAVGYDLLKVFWENHDPTQGERQGNDRGSQYRSMIVYTTSEQRQLAELSRQTFGQTLAQAGRGPITTEILSLAAAGEFWLAEPYHQAYLFHHPRGYCNHGFKGFVCEAPRLTD